ncbi:MAG: hypothetical protein ACJ76P_05320 [Actinomycetota bacterium]
MLIRALLAGGFPWRAIIPAVAAIAAGFVASLTASYLQRRHAAELARAIRREERQEEGLLRLQTALVGIEDELHEAMALTPDSGNWGYYWNRVAEKTEALERDWRGSLSGQILDEHIRNRVNTFMFSYGVLVSGGPLVATNDIRSDTGKDYLDVIAETQRRIDVVLRHEIEPRRPPWKKRQGGK